MNRHDAIDAAARFMASIYGDVYNRQLDETMYSRLQYKMYSMELDGTLLMEREDPLTIGIKGCDDPECGQGPLMS